MPWHPGWTCWSRRGRDTSWPEASRQPWRATSPRGRLPRRWSAGWSTWFTATRSGVPTGRGHRPPDSCTALRRPCARRSTSPRWPRTSVCRRPASAGDSMSCGNRSWCGPVTGEDALRPKLSAQAKVYFTDPVYARLEVDVPPDATVLSEQQLGLALWRSLERERPGSYLGFDRVLYHRTPTRKEIDFVGPELGGWAIESKYVDGRWRRETRRRWLPPDGAASWPRAPS